MKDEKKHKTANAGKTVLGGTAMGVYSLALKC